MNDPGSMIVPVEPFGTFAWPVEPSRRESIPHAVAFCRALLLEFGMSMTGGGFTLLTVPEG